MEGGAVTGRRQTKTSIFPGLRHQPLLTLIRRTGNSPEVHYCQQTSQQWEGMAPASCQGQGRDGSMSRPVAVTFAPSPPPTGIPQGPQMPSKLDQNPGAGLGPLSLAHPRQGCLLPAAPGLGYPFPVARLACSVPTLNLRSSKVAEATQQCRLALSPACHTLRLHSLRNRSDKIMGTPRLPGGGQAQGFLARPGSGWQSTPTLGGSPFLWGRGTGSCRQHRCPLCPPLPPPETPSAVWGYRQK